ncbi:hypothetical protein GF412_02815 [Candidatus Micrarchaeota archaeon]|nr:hypothetical protein [Candidatus Micrarchaeota archaeon]MBD3417890.1 hypothetical protein [Candidatus Micrarchaeota archaeon]
MPRQKSKGRAQQGVRGAEVRQEVRSEVDNLTERWGMELTSQETRQVVADATRRITDPENEVGVKPAVRDQMFAMLMEKAPEKAIKFRMSMYEKKGKTFTPEQKRKIIRAAENKGWRAARAELRSALKETKGKGAKKAERPGPAKPKVAGGRPRKKPGPAKGLGRAEKNPEVAKAETEAPKAESAGVTLAELLENAKHQNEELIRAGEDYNGWKAKMEKLRKDELEEFEKQKPSAAQVLLDKEMEPSNPQYVKAKAEFEAYLEKKGSRASSTNMAETEQRHFEKIKMLKTARDDMIEKAMNASGITNHGKVEKITTARATNYGIRHSASVDKATMGNQAVEFGRAGRATINALKKRARA